MFSSSRLYIFISLIIIFFVGCKEKVVDPILQNNKPIISKVTADPVSVKIGETSTITVSATDVDHDKLAYIWKCNKGYFVSGNGLATITWMAPNQKGTALITVSIGDGITFVSDTVYISICNSAPVISNVVSNPGVLKTGESSTLSVQASDADDDALNYSWSCDNGTFTSGTTEASVTWRAPNQAGRVGFTVTVSDGQESVSDTVSVLVETSINTPPQIISITATPNTLGMGESSTLSVQASDADDDALNYSWSCDNGTFTSGTTEASVTWRAPNQAGRVGFTVAVSDGQESVSDTTSILVVTQTVYFEDDFSEGQSNWSINSAINRIENEELYLRGISDDNYGTARHIFNEVVSPPYNYGVDMARTELTEETEDDYCISIMFNDDEILGIRFDILSILYDSNENWRLLYFLINGSNGPGWYYNDQTQGFNSILSNEVNQWNQITIEIGNDNEIIVKAGSVIICVYQLSMDFDLSCSEIWLWAAMNKTEVKFDNVIFDAANSNGTISTNSGNFSKTTDVRYLLSLSTRKEYKYDSSNLLKKRMKNGLTK